MTAMFLYEIADMVAYIFFEKAPNQLQGLDAN